MPFFLHAIQALLRQPRAGAAGVCLDHVAQQLARLAPVLEFILDVTHFQLGIGCLGAAWVNGEHFVELGECRLELPGHVIDFTKPVLCIIGVAAIRILLEKVLERGGRIVVTTLL